MVIRVGVRHEHDAHAIVQTATDLLARGGMDRRSFLKLPALLPLINFGPACRSDPHHFGYESVIGTSMDLLVCSRTRLIGRPAIHARGGYSKSR